MIPDLIRKGASELIPNTCLERLHNKHIFTNVYKDTVDKVSIELVGVGTLGVVVLLWLWKNHLSEDIPVDTEELLDGQPEAIVRLVDEIDRDTDVDFELILKKNKEETHTINLYDLELLVRKLVNYDELIDMVCGRSSRYTRHSKIVDTL